MPSARESGSAHSAQNRAAALGGSNLKASCSSGFSPPSGGIKSNASCPPRGMHVACSVFPTF